MMIVLPDLIERKICQYLIQKIDNIDDLWKAINEDKGIITVIHGDYRTRQPPNGVIANIDIWIYDKQIKPLLFGNIFRCLLVEED